jgi:hypothetical protein
MSVVSTWETEAAVLGGWKLSLPEYPSPNSVAYTSGVIKAAILSYDKSWERLSWRSLWLISNGLDLLYATMFTSIALGVFNNACKDDLAEMQHYAEVWDGTDTVSGDRLSGEVKRVIRSVGTRFDRVLLTAAAAAIIGWA